MRMIAVGDNCIDDYVKQNRRYAGGCSVNFSVYAKQLGNDSAYLGVVGNDENGRLICKILSDYGVDVSHVHRKDGKTAVTQVELDGNERRFAGYDEGVLGKLTLTEEDYRFIETYDILHTSVFGNAAEDLRRLKGKVLICCDFADKEEYPDRDLLLDIADFAFFSYDKDDDYIRKCLEDAFNRGTVCAVATLGELGSIGYDGSGFYLQKSINVNVIDTIGAGDSFIAGFMSAAGTGESMPQCLKAGAEKAAETIAHFGAF